MPALHLDQDRRRNPRQGNTRSKNIIHATLATARNIAISLLRLAGCSNIARGLDYLSRRLDSVLALIGV